MIFICPQGAVGLRTKRPSVETVPTGRIISIYGLIINGHFTSILHHS